MCKYWSHLNVKQQWTTVLYCIVYIYIATVNWIQRVAGKRRYFVAIFVTVFLVPAPRQEPLPMPLPTVIVFWKLCCEIIELRSCGVTNVNCGTVTFFFHLIGKHSRQKYISIYLIIFRIKSSFQTKISFLLSSETMIALIRLVSGQNSPHYSKSVQK